MRRTLMRQSRWTWSSRLWLLAVALGALTVYSAVATIHDSNQQRRATALVAHATALQLASLGGSRFEHLATATLAPAGEGVWAWPGPPNAVGSVADVRALAQHHRLVEACRCRELLPATHVFAYDVANGRIGVAALDSSAPPMNGGLDSALVGVARAEAGTPASIRTSLAHLSTAPDLRELAAVSVVQRDDHDAPVAVWGMLVNTRATVEQIFSHPRLRQAIDSAGLARLDARSLAITGPRGERLFGTLDDARVRADVPLDGPLRGLRLAVAIAPAQIATPLLVPHSPVRLWHLGALLAATVTVLVIAASASRRELLLARTRSDFIAGVSHDLRMPLAQILMASETLALGRERNEGERQSLTGSIVREAQRLMGLVDNVLLFSRSGAVTLQPVLRPVPVDELLNEVRDAVCLAVDDAEQHLEVVAGSPACVLADRRLVRQALVNLVDNALKYGAPGQHVRLRAQGDDEMVQLSVEDDGPGIPEQERGRVFEPYARLAPDQASERTGTGLGLAVVRQIAEACGGRVWLEGGPSGGTRAVLELRAAA